MSALADKPAAGVEGTTFRILFAVSFCHLLNDMIQALLPALYPHFKTSLDLTFTQVGFITFAFQFTASLLQPAVGLFADRKAMPFSLPTGMTFTLFGLLILSAAHSYPVLLLSAMVVGMGSSVFHPESSRVARMASGGRHGLAQSMFQVGGNIGSALGPLMAAFVVMRYGQSSIAGYALLALLAIYVLYTVGRWYKNHGLRRMKAAAKALAPRHLPRKRVIGSIAVLMALIFSKYFYLTSITSYFTFYLIHRFHVSVATAQIYLFIFLAAVAAGTLLGGPLGDKFGRKYVIWFSILGVLPFTLMMPYADLFWTAVLAAVIGVILASAFSAIVVYGQELIPGRVGTVAGLFFGFAFGMGGIGAAVLGSIADATGIEFVYKLCAYLPLLGLLTALLPDLSRMSERAPADPEDVLLT